jgi:hypothetical protein
MMRRRRSHVFKPRGCLLCQKPLNTREEITFVLPNDYTGFCSGCAERWRIDWEPNVYFQGFANRHGDALSFNGRSWEFKPAKWRFKEALTALVFARIRSKAA